LDDGNFVLKKGPSRETKKMKNPDHKVSINEGAVQELALYGSKDNVTALMGLTAATLARLKIKRLKGVPAFAKIKAYEGGRPSVLDIKRWLDDLSYDARYVEDVEFLKRLHVTLANRDFTSAPED